ncbi:MAG TPA: septum formation initiator family protein [Dissulfurispiraceae bacterium]|nr:septum formation initiator family protein [Dissulfurispiraceae bacterium]
MRGRIQPKNLRQQVTLERRRRSIIFFTIVILAFFYMGIALVLGNMGFLKYVELTKNKDRLGTEINTYEKENKALRAHVSALKDDAFYIEKYAREEYGLAKPGEYIFQFKNDGR